MYTSKLSIKAWAEEDRPREKLLSFGRKHISNAEIIALLLGSGTKEHSALDIAKNILDFCKHDLHRLSKLSVTELTSFNGVGPARAAHLLAAIELSCRIQALPKQKSNVIKGSMDVYHHIKAKIADLSHEEFWVIFLNNSLQVLHSEKISSGGITSVLVDVRIVFNKAINHLATNIVLCHNHPSGKLFPSDADKALTQKMISAGGYLDIKISDHLIVTREGFFSFNDEGLL
jgi:DNA repair protein RadC